MKARTWMSVTAAAVSTAAALAWAFAPRPIDVESAAATRGRFEAAVEEDARTRVRDRYVVSAPLAGQLTRIALREGDTVQAGAELATLLPTLPVLLDERTLRQQQHRVESAEANVERVDARIERAKVAVLQASNDLRRSEQLAGDGFVAPTRLDSERLAVQAAQRELDAARQERHVAGHDLEQARAALSTVSRAGPGRAVVLRAPVAGRVLRVAQTSETAVALGAPLVELGDIGAMEVVAELLTSDALQARAGSPVVIERWGGPGTLEGRVRLIEPSGFTKISALGVEEQRVRVLIDITTPPAQWRALGDGFRVGVRILTLAVDDALLAPLGAVFPLPGGNQGSAVFVIDQGRAKRVSVDVGARNGSVAWIRSGLTAGTPVIVYPPADVVDGKRVRERRA